MELETKVIENEQRSKSNVHRLDRLEERVNEQEKLVTAICGLQKDMEHTKKDVGEIKMSLDEVLEKPAKRWDSVVTAVVTALISVLVGALLGRLI
jgi:hypothetical protein|nr:MAG TPA: hemolysin [Caudoviricetes sp.]